TPNHAYSLRVPPAFGTKVASSLDGVPKWVPPQTQYVIHRVRSGETISQIADRYRTSTKAIARLNRLRQVNRIYPGQKLKVPVRAASGIS
ncbi:LysM peptidoglycan-binding domain-containing protein, partial [Thermodesulfobacteriota bacterium]